MILGLSPVTRAGAPENLFDHLVCPDRPLAEASHQNPHPRDEPDGATNARGEKAMSQSPLMPKATAVWLVDNTALTFEQIAEFCKLHPLEVKGIADGEVATGIKGMDPISSGQLTREEIAAGDGGNSGSGAAGFDE